MVTATESELDREFDVTFSAPVVSQPLTQHHQNSSSRTTASPASPGGVAKKRLRGGKGDDGMPSKKPRKASQSINGTAAGRKEPSANGTSGRGGKKPDNEMSNRRSALQPASESESGEDSDSSSDESSSSSSEESGDSKPSKVVTQAAIARVAHLGGQTSSAIRAVKGGEHSSSGGVQKVKETMELVLRQNSQILGQNSQLIDITRQRDVQMAAAEAARMKTDQQRIEAESRRVEAEKETALRRVALEEARLRVLESELAWLRAVSASALKKKERERRGSSTMHDL